MEGRRDVAEGIPVATRVWSFVLFTGIVWTRRSCCERICGLLCRLVRRGKRRHRGPISAVPKPALDPAAAATDPESRSSIFDSTDVPGYTRFEAQDTVPSTSLIDGSNFAATARHNFAATARHSAV